MFAKLMLAVAVVTMTVAANLAAPARADQTDPRLDRLFALLQTAEGEGEVRTAEALIWRI